MPRGPTLLKYRFHSRAPRERSAQLTRAATHQSRAAHQSSSVTPQLSRAAAWQLGSPEQQLDTEVLLDEGL